MDDLLLKRVLYGISCRNYETAAAAVPGAIGLSSSTVSRTFTRASVQQLKALQDRDLSQIDVVAVFLDGKTFADMTMVMAWASRSLVRSTSWALSKPGQRMRPSSHPSSTACVIGGWISRRGSW